MSAEYWNYVTSGFVPFLTFCVACGMGVFSIGLAVYVVLYMWNGGSEPEFFRSKSVKIKSDKFADPAESKRKKQQRPVVSIKSKMTRKSARNRLSIKNSKKVCASSKKQSRNAKKTKLSKRKLRARNIGVRLCQNTVNSASIMI